MGIDPKPTVGPAPARKGSCLPKALIGCGCAVLLGGLLAVAAVVGLFYFGYRQVDEFTAPYVAQGYKHTIAQIVEETETVTEPTVYSAQTVTIRQGAEDSLAMACQVGEVDGTVNGDIHFFGQTLTIMPDGNVLGDLEADGIQVLTIQGTVQGDVTFFGQVLIIEAGGVVHGDVHAEGAQTINVLGQVLGEIDGSYQTLERTGDIELKPQRIELE